MTELFFYIMGFIGGWFAYGISLQRERMKRVESEVKQVVDKVRANIVYIDVEQDGGMLYAYNKDTKAYLGRGSSRQVLARELDQDYPEKLFLVSVDGGKSYEPI